MAFSTHYYTLLLLAVAVPFANANIVIENQPNLNVDGSCYGSGAKYSVSLSSSWKEAEDVAPFGTEHWSPPVTWSHDGTPPGMVWNEGALSTAGIKEMAELGETGILEWELNFLANVGYVSDQKVIWNLDRYLGHFTPFEGTSWTITVDQAHPFSNTVSMVGPSPDWFLGVNMKMLNEDGSWLQMKEINLDDGYVFDAGTETGDDFTQANELETFHKPISVLKARTLTGGAGTMKFELVQCLV